MKGGDIILTQAEADLAIVRGGKNLPLYTAKLLYYQHCS